MSNDVKELPVSLPQIFPDDIGILAEPGQVVLTLATRFHAYRDGTVETKPAATMTIRMHELFAEKTALDILKSLKQVREAQAKATQEAQKAAVEAELAKRALHAVPDEAPGAQ